MLRPAFRDESSTACCYVQRVGDTLPVLLQHSRQRIFESEAICVLLTHFFLWMIEARQCQSILVDSGGTYVVLFPESQFAKPCKFPVFNMATDENRAPVCSNLNGSRRNILTNVRSMALYQCVYSVLCHSDFIIPVVISDELIVMQQYGVKDRGLCIKGHW